MNKLEKVIKGITCCMDLDNPDYACAICPYYRKNAYGENDCMRGKLMPDAIELLKEQNSLMLALDQSNSANEYLNEEVDKLNALLRQQQDEIAMLTKKAKSPTWRRGKAFCGSCGGCLENKEKHSTDIVSSIRFCKWCGTPVDWSNE